MDMFGGESTNNNGNTAQHTTYALYYYETTTRRVHSLVLTRPPFVQRVVSRFLQYVCTTQQPTLLLTYSLLLLLTYSLLSTIAIPLPYMANETSRCAL